MKSLKNRLKKRTRGRLLAINALYKYELLGDDPLRTAEEEKNNEKEIALEYLKKIYPNLNIIDKLIKKYLINWDFDRILPYDKSIMRFAVGEMLLYPDIPVAVIIEEALKIASLFIDERGVKFINAILDKIGKEVRKD